MRKTRIYKRRLIKKRNKIANEKNRYNNKNEKDDDENYKFQKSNLNEEETIEYLKLYKLYEVVRSICCEV